MSRVQFYPGGSTPPNGISGSIQFNNAGAFGSDASNLFWDDANNRLGIGTGTPTARLHTKGVSDTVATFSFRAENSSNNASVVFDDYGNLGVFKNTSLGVSISAFYKGLYFNTSYYEIPEGATGIQLVASPAPSIFPGLYYSAGIGYVHMFYKGLQMDGVNQPNTVYRTSFGDGGVAGITGSFQVVNISPIINTTGSGSKVVTGLTFNPTLTSTTNTRVYGAVFESGDMLIGAAAGSGSASAQLELVSTTKGFLPPRMTGAQAEAISSPAAGLLVYATTGTGVTITSAGWWGYTGSTWNKLN